jgi:cystathionine beta-lyase
VTDHGRKMLENPLIYENGNYRMDFVGLRKMITKKTKIILLCTPHNPVGRVWSNEELKELTEICIEHHILIVSDEIHQDLVFSDKKHIPTASMSDAVSAITVTCISPSKTFNMAGLSSSAIIISDEQKRKIFDSYVAKLHIGQGNIFGSIALEAAYNHGDNYVDQLNLYLKKNAESIIDFFGERNSLVFPVRPEATFLIWLDFNKLNIPQKKLNDLLVNKAGVALSDGRIYGRGGSGFQRLNFALPKQLLEKGLSQIKEMIH